MPDVAVSEGVDREFEVIRYTTYLQKHGDIEGMPTSGAKALALARRRLRGERLWSAGNKVAHGVNGDALLVIELLHVSPNAEQRRTAFALIKQLDTDSLLGMVTRRPGGNPGQIGIHKILSKYPAQELLEVLDFFSRRLKGGFEDVLKGTDGFEPTGAEELEKRTLIWLQRNKRTAERYFADIWKAHSIVLLGETHFYANVQRRFAANMIRRHGGANVTLAIELEGRYQEAIDDYLAGRRSPKYSLRRLRRDLEKLDRNKSVPTQRLSRKLFNGEYVALFDAARETGTQVTAIDSQGGIARRDREMAAGIEVERDLGNKVLFYGGGYHVMEGRSGSMGRRLARIYGSNVYAIDMEYKATYTDGFWTALRQSFPSMRTIGFDIDASPLKWRKDPRLTQRLDLGTNLDGRIYFLRGV